ncbi:hypothetical protein PpBr36_04234 [Pyricularia pennisetigena]|uniref:hypothetical protein n=1 Tax=Pyricularia pennisetigena TaxID=1578925 RepID=UPI001151741E|nr:hypothetical protein PpBr36_04234 [Pyricularia pennisetigena]TLS27432.1 hypothetical protein PpBr36_04234 [Pyricularia pennisetigena]
MFVFLAAYAPELFLHLPQILIKPQFGNVLAYELCKQQLQQHSMWQPTDEDHDIESNIIYGCDMGTREA